MKQNKENNSGNFFIMLMLGAIFAHIVPTKVALITAGVLTLLLIAFMCFCMYWEWKNGK